MAEENSWKYYVPEHGEDTTDARAIAGRKHRPIVDAEDAAELAAEDEWDNCDGWEAGVGDGPIVVVVASDGKETHWQTCRDAIITHSVTELE